jgi:hypothetical protein
MRSLYEKIRLFLKTPTFLTYIAAENIADAVDVLL